ncbi:2-dehydropantoate 2-reductase (Ketopantoate reductase) (KPA reductase) (KPR), partial [Spiromyces aspiralis]
MPIDALKRRIQGSAAAADRMPRFYVLGAGAVGKLYAAHLRREGHDVTLLLRTPQRRDEFINWARLSIKITEVYRQQLNAQPSLCCSGSDVPAGIEPWVARGIEAEVTDRGYKQGQQSSPSSRDAASSDQPQIERLLVTTKAYDTKNALSLIWHRLGSDSVIVLLGNGMGVAEEVLDYARRATSGIMHKAPSILLATTYLGCMSGSNGSFHSLHTGLGPTYIASEALPGTPPLPHKHVESTLGQLTRLPLDVRVVPLSEIRYLMARKLAVNA